MGEFLQAAVGRHRADRRAAARRRPSSAGATTTARPGPGADVQAEQGPVDPGRVPRHRLGLQPVPDLRACARRRAEGHPEGLRAAAGRRERRLDPDLGEREALGIEALPQILSDAIVRWRSPNWSETLGDGVFDYFLRNKREEWDEYRRNVTQFELDRYLAIL